jgi:transcriptional regulator with XRE-family HTH domain
MERYIAPATLFVKPWLNDESDSLGYGARVSIMDIRRDRLTGLLPRYETQANLARAIGIAPTYLYQLLRGLKGIGEGRARRIESALDLPEGYLDGRSDPLTPAERSHLELYRAAPEAVRGAVDTMLRAAVPEQKRGE